MFSRFCFFILMTISSLLWSQQDYIKKGCMPTQSPFSFSPCGIYIPYNPIIIEIGGGTGNITKQLAEIKEKGTVYSFEPIEENFNKLEENTQVFENVYVFPIGISATTGIHQFLKPVKLLHPNRLNNLDNNFFNFSSLLDPAMYLQDSYQYNGTNVDCENLEKWCQNNDIHEIDILYLDACGYEGKILSSSINIVKTAKAIYLKTYDRKPLWKGQDSFNFINNLLTQSGFILYTHWHQINGNGFALYIKTNYYRGAYERKYL